MSSSRLPTTRFAQSGDASIAYQVMGDGPIDLVVAPGIINNVELFHDIPGYTDFFARLAKFARVVVFDKRGQGLSDRVSGAITLEQRVDDVRAVMRELGMNRVVLVGISEAAALAGYFAATFPEQISHLVVMHGVPKFARSDGYEWGAREEDKDLILSAYGSGRFLAFLAPTMFSGGSERIELAARCERQSCSPGNFRAMLESNMKLDVLALLPQIRAPTLIIHRKTDTAAPIESGRYMASLISGAKMIEQDGGDHFFLTGDYAANCMAIEEFVTGSHHDEPVSLDRILATVLFTDISGSTARAVEIGDSAWRQLLDEHDRIVRRLIEQHRGRLIKSTGDGVLAIFDGPGRAIRCALGMDPALARLRLSVRAGLHTGEVEVRGEDIGGVAVHVASRVMSKAKAGEVLVSRVVSDLVAGSGITFEDRGDAELSGIPGPQRLLAASA
ncbi:MAG: adenylate/guanylate cyclase domain-containing protein [Proteobacteria bacterium]|nr:adenylate/guanylate cyclase domain-containing protein [Pseudomonadota bacterium]